MTGRAAAAPAWLACARGGPRTPPNPHARTRRPPGRRSARRWAARAWWLARLWTSRARGRAPRLALRRCRCVQLTVLLRVCAFCCLLCAAGATVGTEALQFNRLGGGCWCGAVVCAAHAPLTAAAGCGAGGAGTLHSRGSARCLAAAALPVQALRLGLAAAAPVSQPGSSPAAPHGPTPTDLSQTVHSRAQDGGAAGGGGGQRRHPGRCQPGAWHGPGSLWTSGVGGWAGSAATALAALGGSAAAVRPQGGVLWPANLEGQCVFQLPPSSSSRPLPSS